MSLGKTLNSWFLLMVRPAPGSLQPLVCEWMGGKNLVKSFGQKHHINAATYHLNHWNYPVHLNCLHFPCYRSPLPLLLSTDVSKAFQWLYFNIRFSQIGWFLWVPPDEKFEISLWIAQWLITDDQQNQTSCQHISQLHWNFCPFQIINLLDHEFFQDLVEITFTFYLL